MLNINKNNIFGTCHLFLNLKHHKHLNTPDPIFKIDIKIKSCLHEC